MGMDIYGKYWHIISYNLNVPATHNPTLRLRSTSAAVHVSAYFAISFRKMTSTSSSFFNYMYVRRTSII